MRGGLGVAAVLDRWAGHETPVLLGLAAFGSFISYIYSAPPLKLKQSGQAGGVWGWAWGVGVARMRHGIQGGPRARSGFRPDPPPSPTAQIKPIPRWIGNYALGSSYITLPWLAGQALFGTLSWDVVVLTMLYSVAGLGIAIVNDFKSIEGDR